MRERRHTDGVHDFVSLLMSSCRESRVWSLVQALPAHRWERRYKYGTRRRGRFRDIMRAVRPDATLILCSTHHSQRNDARDPRNFSSSQAPQTSRISVRVSMTVSAA